VSELAPILDAARATGDYTALLAHLPYTRALGLSATCSGGVLRLCLPCRAGLIGNPALPALHGGVVGACLETAALLQILHERGSVHMPKTIDFTVDYLRAARAVTLHAEAELQRSGRRIVNVRMRAFQGDPSAPVALGRGNFLVE
jgi:uncharacterized protein (TIGR00369 family)